MPKEAAKKHYLSRAYNCAQAVVKSFAERYGLGERAEDKYASYGGGGAPGGLCGAYAAARDLLAGSHPEKLVELEKTFLEAAGSIKCKEIREKGIISCLGCVSKAADYLNEHGKKA